MRVNEIFYSLQGEGILTGVPSVFIRLAGCPLRCRWCDTKYGWDEKAAAHYSIETIVQTVGQYPSKYVVITGGEPMMDSELPNLVRKLKESTEHLTIETAGIAFVPDLDCDLMSISPKLSNSTPAIAELAEIHEKSRLDIAVLSELVEHYDYQLKFVVDSQDDLIEIQQVIEQIGNVDLKKVMLMPQAENRHQLLAKSPMVADMCKRAGFIFCQRLQVLLWDNQKGT
jgi:7-carboxy-7-deazaguanine synthase